jgi:methylated-DNA-[protein]-cysteine S-methyltransferase
VPKAKKMQKTIKYTIFKTKWGYFGLAATDKGLLRSCLPLAEREKAKSQLLQNLPDPQYDKTLFKPAQEQITAYFEGACINFSAGFPIVLSGFSSFAGLVLTACRDTEFGRTVSYGRLAEMASRPGAARAVGGALARNPLPLIIPCHRVVCANGKIGGFSAMGGVSLKKRMLKLEAE